MVSIPSVTMKSDYLVLRTGTLTLLTLFILVLPRYVLSACLETHFSIQTSPRQDSRIIYFPAFQANHPKGLTPIQLRQLIAVHRPASPTTIPTFLGCLVCVFITTVWLSVNPISKRFYVQLSSRFEETTHKSERSQSTIHSTGHPLVIRNWKADPGWISYFEDGCVLH